MSIVLGGEPRRSHSFQPLLFGKIHTSQSPISASISALAESASKSSSPACTASNPGSAGTAKHPQSESEKIVRRAGGC